MSECPIQRVVRIMQGVRRDLNQHTVRCGDRVQAVALNPRDHQALRIVELWGLPVLAWEEVPEGRFHVLCERDGVLIPQVETAQDVLDRFAYDLRRPLSESA